MKKTSRALLLGSVTLGVGLLAAACGASTQIPVVQNDSSELGAIDAGTGKCGASICASGELCCESADESCSPTCTKATKCAVYGRPCKTTGAGDAGPALTWRKTCGDPVCRVPSDAGADAAPPPPACPALGSPCSDKGLTCGDRATAACGVIQVCDDHEAGSGPGGCPISTKKFKDDIGYVDEGALQRLHDETLQMRLATYRYKGPFIDPKDPSAKHLGFIIEDQPQSLSVDRGHDRVDLYGYMSMAVATMQVQEKEITQLRREIAEVRATCAHQPR